MCLASACGQIPKPRPYRARVLYFRASELKGARGDPRVVVGPAMAHCGARRMGEAAAGVARKQNVRGHLGPGPAKPRGHTNRRSGDCITGVPGAVYTDGTKLQAGFRGEGVRLRWAHLKTSRGCKACNLILKRAQPQRSGGASRAATAHEQRRANGRRATAGWRLSWCSCKMAPPTKQPGTGNARTKRLSMWVPAPLHHFSGAPRKGCRCSTARILI